MAQIGKQKFRWKKVNNALFKAFLIIFIRDINSYNRLCFTKLHGKEDETSDKIFLRES